jgi:hypothetical protein
MTAWFQVLWLGVVVLCVFAAGRQFPNLFTALSAPLGRIDVSDTSRFRPLFASLRNLGCLLALYFFVGTTFGLAGGRTEIALLKSGVSPRDGAMLGLTAGILTCVIARFMCVYQSTMPARALYIYILGVFAVAAWYCPVFYNDLTVGRVSDGWDAIGDNCQYLLVYAVLATAMAACVTELLIIANGYYGSASYRLVPYSLVTARWEDHERAEQIFLPDRVRTRTDREIRDQIASEPPDDICWITATAPDSHLESLVDATAKLGMSRDEAGKAVAHALRVICPLSQQDEIRRRARSAGIPFLKVRGFGGVPRLRLLVYNRKCAIVHLPIPFGDREGRMSPTEESNFAAITQTPERINRLKAHFEFSWRQHCALMLQEEVQRMIKEEDRVGLALIKALCGRRGGQLQDVVELTTFVQRDTGEMPEPRQMASLLRRLVERQVVWNENGLYWGNPETVCGMPEQAVIDAVLGL